MQRIIVMFTCVLFICAGPAFAGSEVHWGYSGHEGPVHWGELSPDYTLCGSGRNQSPINLTALIESELSDITFDYKDVPLEVENNGHTIKVNYAEGSTIKIDGRTFQLLQFHFHAPSENIIEGASFPMEAHLVHADDSGNLAVIAVMFTEGEENAVLAPVWQHMPAKAGKTNTASDLSVNVMGMLPENKAYYRFNGSLTTPPCTEGVLWLVLKDPVQTSRKHLEVFRSVMHHDNNRPVQPAYARPVLQ